MQIRSIFLAMLVSVSAPVMAFAQTDATLKRAFDAGDDDQWDAAFGLVGNDLLARDLLTWAKLRSGVGEFSEYTDFIAKHPDWPGLDRLRNRGDEAITAETPADVIVEWFRENPPETGEGALNYARALTIVGRGAEVEPMLAQVWQNETLSESSQDALMAGYGALLDPHHVTRIDNLLWRWRTEQAEQMMDLLDESAQNWAQARIALIRKSSDALAKAAAVPAPYNTSASLAYDLYNYYSDRGERTAAIGILMSRTESAEALQEPFRWSGWRRSHARWLMREGRYSEAYKLASEHHLQPNDGVSYSDLEWLAGYVSLRFLKKPEQALQHFLTMQAAVDTPISDGRAAYWIGRTFEAMGDANSAAAAYADGAQHQTAFYGLLAAEKLSMPLEPDLAGGEVFPDYAASEAANNEIVQAGFRLLEAGERGSAVLFFAQAGRTLDRSSLGSIGAELMKRDEPFFTLLVGKSAATRGLVIPDIYFPIHAMSEMDLPAPMEMALSIARRESEFNHVVGSSVGALGLMQVMPGTAEEVAGVLGLPYSKSRLTADWPYNAQLGSKYLAMLEERFGYSPTMIAAGYNAGPGRPLQWMAERGDPRQGEVDVIDWIEMIPFRETRNYVQRVTESLPVYRARLTGEVGPVRFTDMLIGVKPIVRPVARDDVSVEATTSDLAPQTSPRPLARED